MATLAIPFPRPLPCAWADVPPDWESPLLLEREALARRLVVAPVLRARLEPFRARVDPLLWRLLEPLLWRLLEPLLWRLLEPLLCRPLALVRWRLEPLLWRPLEPLLWRPLEPLLWRPLEPLLLALLWRVVPLLLALLWRLVPLLRALAEVCLRPLLDPRLVVREADLDAEVD